MKTTPVVAIVGRPNVGKSSLFNYFTNSRDALVADIPGVTRDRIYGKAKIEERSVIVVDTGGIGDDLEGIEGPLEIQAREAIAEADLVLFMVDAGAGVTAADEDICQILRKYNKKIFLIVNKIDVKTGMQNLSDFYRLGFSDLIDISLTHRRHTENLKHKMHLFLFGEVDPEAPPLEDEEYEKRIVFSVCGRPNVGKSTLVNRMLGEDRVVVYDRPGTTTDSIAIPFERHGENYTIIDTAGVRRKSKADGIIEKFSIVKTLQSIENAHVVLYLFDAHEGLSDQDLHLMSFVLEAGRALVIVANKWDYLPDDQKDTIKEQIQFRLRHLEYIPKIFISALHGTNVGHLYEWIKRCHESSHRDLATPQLTKLLIEATDKAQPPLVHGRRIKLRYAHAGGKNPQTIVIHGNQTDALPLHYLRYLEKFFRQELDLVGVPIRLIPKTSINPFAGRKNILTPRQRRKRERLMKHVKRK